MVNIYYRDYGCHPVLRPPVRDHLADVVHMSIFWADLRIVFVSTQGRRIGP